MNILQLIGRNQALFDTDIQNNEQVLSSLVAGSRFLVIGGAGSIGQAVTREIFKRKPKVLHVVDISENNMVELVRDIRSSYGYIDGDFQTFALDVGSVEYDAFIKADVTHELHIQAEMFLDNLTDQTSNHWVILLSQLIDNQLELERL